jgi:hypothetical protein
MHIIFAIAGFGSRNQKSNNNFVLFSAQPDNKNTQNRGASF